MNHNLRSYWLLAFGITWGAGAVGLVLAEFVPSMKFSPASPLYFLAGWGPTLAGLIVTGREGGAAGIRHLLSRARPKASSVKWYALVLLGYPAAAIVLTWLTTPIAYGRVLNPVSLTSALAVALVRDTGPLGEEFGWRGVALPALLRRRSPLGASCVLGIIWGAWHIPTFFVGGLTQSHLSPPLFLLNCVALSIIMTWLYVRTNGDLLPMILLHLVTNFSVPVLVSFQAQAAITISAAGAIVAFRGLARSPVDAVPSAA